MKTVSAVLLSILLTCLVATALNTGALCTSPFAAATSTTWQAHYLGNELPDQSDPAWMLVNIDSADVSILNGILRIDTIDCDGVWEYWLHTSFNHSKGYSVKVGLRCEAYPNPYDLHQIQVTFGDGATALSFFVYPSRIDVRGTSYMVYVMDTTDSFHEYLIEVKGDDFMIYVDGALRIDGTGKNTAPAGFNYLIFGDGGVPSSGAVALWDYVIAWDSEDQPPLVVGGRTSQIALAGRLAPSEIPLTTALHTILLVVSVIAITKLRKGRKRHQLHSS